MELKSINIYTAYRDKCDSHLSSYCPCSKDFTPSARSDINMSVFTHSAVSKESVVQLVALIDDDMMNVCRTVC